ncbi:MAG: Asp23/Gls24 family envelope stress response protein [Rhabdochlamydiaceae bacterium]|nr:Asp23/Gls24 family envelope stress response protein [Rhabdochlamydiaceae bacterium]
MNNPLNQIDAKELELPDTLLIRDIENRVFQSICLQCLAQIEGIETLEGNLIDSLLGRDLLDNVKGIHVEQDQREHSVNVKVEVNVAYGVCIPEKAEEIQSRLVQDISKITGLHVGCVHVVFKNLISPQVASESVESVSEMLDRHIKHTPSSVEKYDEEF